ncbi:sensor histidine kinase [Streptomyces sp. NPDC088745]|uniref:sensor histidine kinase n=1 Tax=Streptomyces sp. NPDC088745 TaxID=3365884 RepID=UPI0038041113
MRRLFPVRRLWPVSVRWHTALTAALLCASVFAAGWLGTRAFLRAQLTANALDSTRTELDRMADAYRAAAAGSGRAALTATPASGDALFEVVADSGRPVVSSAELRRLDPAWRPLPPAPAGASADWTTRTSATLRPGAHPQWREYRSYTVLGRVVDGVPADLLHPLGRTGRTLGAELDGAAAGAGPGRRAETENAPGDAAGPRRLTLYLYVPPWDTQRTLDRLDDTLAFFVPLAVLLTAGAAWCAAGRALRPVEAIRRELARVSGHQLGRRVPVPPSRDEVARLARTTNDTLDRLQLAHQQQERFVADASHELRSPLAALRTGLEVALAHPDRADWPAAARRALADVQRLQLLTADLLHLAVDPDRAPRPPGVVDLADVVREQVAERALDPAGPRVRAEADDCAPVPGDPAQLERLLRNLLDNAARHARAEVTITVRESRPPGAVVLEVLDDGPGIPAADRERVFERFTRLDSARTRDAGGTGLGLTLARDIAARHGGTLRVGDSPAGARLVAHLPSGGAPGAAGAADPADPAIRVERPRRPGGGG